jgi:hypothetical protein
MKARERVVAKNKIPFPTSELGIKLNTAMIKEETTNMIVYKK